MPLLLAIMGPTASGKTGLAEALADRLDAQLVNADAFQVYREMDIGTAKPKHKSLYRLLDLKNPDEEFGLGEWLRLAEHELGAAFRSGRHVVVVGGTGLYIRALMEQYDNLAARPDPAVRERLAGEPIDALRERLNSVAPAIAAQVDMANPIRVRRALERLETPAIEPVQLPPFQKLKLALVPSADLVEQRIRHRTEEMVQNGWSQEISRLRQRGYKREDPGLRAIGYCAFWDQLDGKMGLDEAIAATIGDTRRYAKRQRTWLRTEPDLVEISAATENDAIRTAMERVENVLM